MTKNEALTKIFELVRSAHTRKVSDLNDLEKHAVAFCCSYFPAVVQNGKLKYLKTAKETDLSVEFVLMNSIATKLGVEFKKFVAASVHVWPDQELPAYETAPIEVALNEYPRKFYIPTRKNEEYIHLPHIKFPTQDLDVDGLVQTIALELYAMQAYQHLDIPLTKNHSLIVREMRKYPEDVIKLENKFNLNILEWANSTPLKFYSVKTSNYYRPEDFKGASFLSAYIYSIAKGIYLGLDSAEDL